MLDVKFLIKSEARHCCSVVHIAYSEKIKMIKINVDIFKTGPGILKIIEWVKSTEVGKNVHCKPFIFRS